MIKSLDELAEIGEECYVAFKPPISYGGLPPRTGVILWYLPETADETNIMYCPVLEHVGPPHTIIAYKAADEEGNCEGAWEVDYDRRSELNSAIAHVVSQYEGEVVVFDGIDYHHLTEPIDNYTVLFDPD